MSVAHCKELAMLDLVENWNGGNVDLIDEIYTPDTVLHSMGGVDHHGRGAVKRLRLRFREIWPDAVYSSDQLVSNTNLIANRWTAIGANGRGSPVSPTCGITTHRIEGDRIAETWRYYGLKSILRALGAHADDGRAECTWGTRGYCGLSQRATPDANIQTQERAFQELWNGRRLDLIPEIIHPEFVHHDPINATCRGHEGYLRFIKGWEAAVSDDARFELHETVAEGEYVYTRWTARYRHAGELMGIPASQRRIVHPGMTLCRFKGDKWIEAWNIWDVVALLEQMGARAGVPAPS